MLNRKFFIGIALVLLLSIITVVMAATPSIDPPSISPSSPVSSTDDTSQAFTFNVNQTVNISWQINGTEVDSQTDVTSGSYTNSTPAVGIWNVTAVVSNINGTVTNQWDWTVNAAAASGVPSLTPVTPPNPSSTQGTYQTFSATSNQTVNFTWSINGTQVEYDSSNTTATYKNNTADISVYNVTVVINNSNGVASYSWDWTVTDGTPPASITNLTLENNGTSWIKWNWTNPTVDFDHVAIWINNVWNYTSNNFYNSTGLVSGTQYIIAIKTVDSSGNINSTWVNLTSYTSPNTDTGSGVSVTTINNTIVTFSNVDIAGNTIDVVESSPPSYDFNPVGTFYNITTDANYTGTITVEIPYNTGVDGNYVKLFHYEGVAWKDVTTSRNLITKTVTGQVSSLSPFVVGMFPGPSISPTPNTATHQTIGSELANFTATFNQSVNVSWYVNGSTPPAKTETSVTSSFYLDNTPQQGTWNITVIANNSNGSVSKTWIWNVRSKTYSTGNRVWDASKDMSTTYTWNPMSFYAFYYDLNGNVGNESLKITLGSKTDRTIDDGDLVYTAAPDPVSFKYSDWGSYNVIGFMAEKYFAGYPAGSPKSTDPAISTLSGKQLHKVLTDEDTKRTVYVGSTLTLAEGYVLKVKDISADRQIILALLKDGGEVDSDVVSEDETYVYYKKVGTVSDLPIIVVHIKNIFGGAETSAVFTDGIFQISESYTSVNRGNKYGIMEITGVTGTSITMKNEDTISLSAGTTSDVMGDIKIKVADNGSVLRFAPTVQKTGVYEVRGTISPNTETTPMWNPMNFEGFYYDLDEDVGSENITLTRTDRTIAEDDLVYTSTPQSVSFEYSAFGSYNVIGFMAQKYFAGYPAGSPKSTDPAISTISGKQLHKVLTDDKTRRSVYVGSTLTLSEGYVLKVTDISADRQIIISLLKDGDEVDSDVVSENTIYAYRKKVGTVSDLPIIAVNIKNIFAGAEASAAFVEGIFQISESYTKVTNGDQFGIMEVSDVSATKIQMKNTNTVTLTAGNEIDIMGDIKFKVADDVTNSSVVRFYPYITIDSGVVSANQLTVDAPANPMERDTITITVTAGSGTAVEGAEVSFDSTVIGTTDSAGEVEYTLASSGIHNISATKLGYEADVKSIDVKEYVDTQLKFELPTIIDQGVPVTIKVTSGDNTVAGASIKLDSSEIGTTDIRGELNHSFDISGTHNLGASKTNYISVVREINIRMPFSEYKALDINLSPPVIPEGEETVIKANITNTGTKADDRQVELIINGTVVDNKSLALEPGEVKEINFTREVELPKGNYTVEILGQKDVLRVDEKSTNILWIGGILTGLGAIVIYFLTSKKITLVMVKEFIANLNAETVKEGLRNAPDIIRDGLRNAPGTIKASLTKAGWKLKDMFNELMSKFRK